MDKALQRLVVYAAMIIGVMLIAGIHGGCRWNSDFRDRDQVNPTPAYLKEPAETENISEVLEPPIIEPDNISKKPQPRVPVYPCGVD